MKKLSLLWAAAFAVTSMFMTSCKDEEVDPVKPTIAIVGSSSTSFSVKPGADVAFEVSVKKGDKNLDKLTFRIDGGLVSKERIMVGGKAATTDGEFSVANESAVYSIVIKAKATAGTETVQLAIVDKDALTAGLTLNITTSNYVVSSYSAKLLGAQNAAAGSFLNNEGVVKSKADATSASNIVLSYASITAGSSLVSPNSVDRKALGLDKGGSDNSVTTYFATTTLDFATATGDAIAGVTASNKSVVIAKGSTYVFVQGNLKGLVKVTDLISTDTGSVTVDVKWVTVISEAKSEVIAAK
jgi:hypothetical protein